MNMQGMTSTQTSTQDKEQTNKKAVQRLAESPWVERVEDTEDGAIMMVLDCLDTHQVKGVLTRYNLEIQRVEAIDQSPGLREEVDGLKVTVVKQREGQ